MKRYFVSGSTGYMGSHLILEILKAPGNEVYCVVRSKTDEKARSKLLHVLENELETQGVRDISGTLDSIQNRLFVVKGDIVEENLGIDEANIKGFPQFDEVLHLAASLKFAYEQKDEIMQLNYTGTKNMLDFTLNNGSKVFNYISTAYVSGTRGGRIPETEFDTAFGCNNMYEESKRSAESHAIAICREKGQKFRVLRPAVIIGHSRTFMSTSESGLYGLLRGLIDFYYAINARQPGYFKENTLKIHADPGMELNLIPIDFVARDCAAVLKENSTIGKFHHISTTSQTSIRKLFESIDRVLNLFTTEIVHDEKLLGPVDRLLQDQLVFFNSYFHNCKHFDRSNCIHLQGIVPAEEHTRIEGNMDGYIEKFLERDNIRRILNYYNKRCMAQTNVE